MKQIDIAGLWRMAEVKLNRDIFQSELSLITGIRQATLSKMKSGKYCQDKKIEAVVNALYEISGLKRPKKIIISWLE
jgi:DNA-binding Xre family transcriptional regulator